MDNPLDDPRIYAYYYIVRERLQRARRKRGWTITQMAERLDCTHATISRKESGERPLSVPELLVYATELNIKPRELFSPLSAEENDTFAHLVRTRTGLTADQVAGQGQVLHGPESEEEG